MDEDNTLEELTSLFEHLFGGNPTSTEEQKLESKPALSSFEDNNDSFQCPIKTSWKNIGVFSPGVQTDKHHVKGHDGIDMQAPKGTPIYPIGPGVVVRAGSSEEGGNYVTTSHLNGLVTAYYAHCNEVHVKAGDKVTNGTSIATVGNTGNAKGTSAHLHLEVKKNGSLIDPQQIFGEPINLKFSLLREIDLFYKKAFR